MLRSPPVPRSCRSRAVSRSLEQARSACSRGGGRPGRESSPRDLVGYHSIMTQPTPKRVSDSAIHDQTAIVFPNDLNTVGTLYGGRVLEQADRVAAVVAKRHSGSVCVTLGVDTVRFLAPARHGDILVFQAAANRVWAA